MIITDLPKRSEVKQTESPIEERLFRALWEKGCYAEPQFAVGPYRIDLAFPEIMLAIECDGKEWHSSPEQRKRDETRDSYLRAQGWQVVRIAGSDIYREAYEIARKVAACLERRPFVREWRMKRRSEQEEEESENSHWDNYLPTQEEIEDRRAGQTQQLLDEAAMIYEAEQRAGQIQSLGEILRH